MAQIAALEGQQLKNKATGETVTASAVQDVNAQGGKGQFFSSQYEIVKPDSSEVLTPDTIENVPEPTIPTMTTPQQTETSATNEAGNIATMTQNSIESYINRQTAEEKQRADLIAQLGTAQEGLQDKEARLLAEEQRLGVAENINKLQGINQQIAQLQAGLDMGVAAEEARPIARQFITGRVAEMKRQATAEIGGLSMVAQALQGNIALAQQTAARNIELEFAPQEREIENIKTLLELNYQDLSRADKKKADILQLKLQDRQANIDAQKDTRTAINNIVLEAVRKGAGEQTINSMMEAKTIEDAVLASSGYLSDIQNSSNVPTKIGQDSKGNDLFYYNGEVVNGDSLLGVDNSGFGFDTDGTTFDSEAVNLATAIRDGQKKLSDIKDPDMEQRVIEVQKTLPPSETAVKSAEEMIALLRQLYDPDTDTSHPGLNSSVGANFFGRVPVWDLGGNKDNFMAIANQVISKNALDKLIEAKSQGATFGALSDTEMQILKSAATAFAGREKGTGYDVTADFFKKEITKFINDYQELVDKARDPMGLLDDEQLSMYGELEKIPDGANGGQCGMFVNKLTDYKLSLGDSYQNKLSKMDSSIAYPEPGMVFVSPYKNTGHTGFILSVNPEKGTVVVKDSNYGLEEKVRTRTMPISKITGLARV